MSTGSAVRAASPGAAADRVVPGAWYTLAVILLIGLYAFIDRQVLTLAGPSILTDLSLSDSEFGLVQGLAFALFSVLAVYPIAWAADRFDERLVLSVCVIIWSAGTALCGLATSFSTLFLAVIAIAAGEAAITPISYAIIPKLFRGEKRQLANSIYYIFSFIGVAIGLALGGAIIGMIDGFRDSLPVGLQSLESWRIAFFIAAAPMPVFLVLLATMSTRKREEMTVSDLSPQAGDKESLVAFVMSARGFFLRLFGGLGFYMLAFAGYLVWLPVVTARLYGTTPEENGLAMGIASGSGMLLGVGLGVFFTPRLVKSRGGAGALRTCWLALALGTPIIPMFALVDNSVSVFVAFGLLMIPGTLVGSVVPTIIQDVAPSSLRTRMFAVFSITAGLLSGSAPTLIGVISDTLSEERAILVALVAVSFPAWIAATLMLRSAEGGFGAVVEQIALQGAEPVTAGMDAAPASSTRLTKGKL
ncbi:MAG: MFS transporter [Gammaproteobacteria bacterium]